MKTSKLSKLPEARKNANDRGTILWSFVSDWLRGLRKFLDQSQSKVEWIPHFFHPYIENCSQKESWDCIDCIRNKYIYFGLPLHHWMSTTTWVTFMEFRVCQTTVGGFRLKIWYTLWVLSLQEMNGRRLWVKFERFSGHIFWNLQNVYFCSQVNPNPNPPPLPHPGWDATRLQAIHGSSSGLPKSLPDPIENPSRVKELWK